MLAARDLGRAARSGRLMAALAVGALPILIVATTAAFGGTLRAIGRIRY